MRSAATDEADALASLFGGASTTDRHLPAPASGTPISPVPAARATPGRLRIVIALLGSFAALLALVFVLSPLGEAWPPFAGAAAFAAVLAGIAFGAARLSGGRLLGPGTKALRQAALWSGIGLGAMLWCVLALTVGGHLQPDGAAAGPAVLVGLMATLLQATGEELFFRGWVQPVIERLARPSVALLATAALFAAIHLAGNWFAPLSLVNILLAGLWFGLLAQRTGGLAAPIAAHWAWNGAELCVFGLYPNPGVGPWGAVLGRDITGAALWGGGEEGLNASVLASLTLGAIVLLLLSRRRRSGAVQLT